MRAAILGRMEPTPPGRELLLAAADDDDEPAAPPSSLEARMGRRIAAQRALMGLSAEDLAQHSGLPLARLRAYEAGRRRVTPPDLMRLCDALQVGPACFLDGAAE